MGRRDFDYRVRKMALVKHQPHAAQQQPRSRRAKIERLRRRIDQLPPSCDQMVLAVLKGILDLMAEDEECDR